MNENKKTPKKRHYDTKISCPGCGERIGIVQPDCPFCGEYIPFWSDRAKKIFIFLGCFVIVGYLFSVSNSWEKGDRVFGFLAECLFYITFIIAGAERASRY